MSNTPNLDLVLTPEADTTTTFKNWRLAINGEGTSNMVKIDEAYAQLDVRVTDAQAKADAVSEKVFGGGDITSWKDVQDIVRAGAASQYFSIGDQFVAEQLSSISGGVGDSTGITAISVTNATFLAKVGETKAGTYTYTYDGANWRDESGATVNLTQYGIALTGTPAVGDTAIVTVATTKYTFDVIGIDHDTPSDNTKTHSMTLQLHALLSATKVFDAREAFYYAADGLTAGTYFFTVQNDDWYTSDNSKKYQFTLANDLPAGGQLVFTNSYNATFANSTINVFTSSTSTTAVETPTLTLGNSGTDLGAVNNTGNMNHMHRALLGNNRWSQSALRQWLNTDAAGNSWWVAKNNFDRPANASSDGFLKNFDAAFLGVLGNVAKTTQLSTADGYGLESSDEKFFLLSRPEVYGGVERSADGSDGTVYAYYGAGYSSLNAPGTGADSHRKKYKSGSAYYWWLRTPNAGYGSYVRYVSTDGSIDSHTAYIDFGVAPACAIV